MAGFRFSRVPKHQKFEYKPRYYDPEKEEMENRLRRVKQIEDDSVEGAKGRIKGSFRNKTKGFGADRKFRSQQVKRSNIRLVIIIAALIAVGYYVLNQNLSGLSVWLDELSH